MFHDEEADLGVSLSERDPDGGRLNDRIAADLKKVYADDPAGLSAVLGTFETEVQSKLGQIRQAAESRDFTAVNALGHAVTGAAAMIGAARLSNLSADLQALAKRSDAGSLDAAIALLEEELPLSLAALHKVAA